MVHLKALEPQPSEKIKDDYPGLDFLNFQDILSSKAAWYKRWWIFTFIINLVLGGVCTALVLSEYLARPTATLISYKSLQSLALPQVTICGTVPDHINFDRFYNHAVPILTETVTNSTLMDLVVYVLAGSGFQKFETIIATFNTTYMSYLNNFYSELRGNRTTEEYFYFGQDEWGMNCQDLFQQCKLGSDTLDCCKVFQPTYTFRRGRCFRSVHLEQGIYDEQGKLGLRFKEPPKLFQAWSNSEIMLFLNEYKTDIEPFPRYYLYAHDFNKFRLTATHMTLIPNNGVCNEKSEDMGKSTCYLESWLIENLETPYNCTYPYMRTLRNTTKSSCPPEQVVREYKKIISSVQFGNKHNCTLSCDRWEYLVNVEKTTSNFTKEPYKYRADINFNDLQYQEIKEVATITFLGLISQMGGQLGLFLGSSLIDLIQLGLIISILISRYAKEVCKKCRALYIRFRSVFLRSFITFVFESKLE